MKGFCEEKFEKFGLEIKKSQQCILVYEEPHLQEEEEEIFLITNFSKNKIEVVKFSNSFVNSTTLDFKNEDYLRFCASIFEKNNYVEVIEMIDINIEFQLESFYHKNLISFSNFNREITFSQYSTDKFVVLSNIISPIKVLNLIIHITIEINSHDFLFGKKIYYFFIIPIYVFFKDLFLWNLKD
jgi:hypothetical protein